jgi:mycothiol system anti-sigma-R factor
MSDGNTLRCAGIQRFVDTYLDSEFAESERVEFEHHLQECESCRKKVKVQADWRIAIRAAAPRERAPAALRNRVQRSIALEAKKKSGAQRSWRTFATRVLPLAAAAGLVGSFMMSRMSMSPVAADVIAKHQRNMPIEVAGPINQVRRWYSDKLSVPVNPPALCKTCQLRGGRLAEVANQQAAYLMYDDNGNKVSVFIFDPSSVPLELPDKTTVDSRDVYLDQEHGYNVAVFRDHGVGYAIAGDLDRQQMLKFVSAAVSQP